MHTIFTKVFIGGMPRSGSTFTFNVVRELLAASGPVVYEAAVNFNPKLLKSDAHYINKAHHLEQDSLDLVRAGGLKCVMTIRNPRDAVASWMHTFGFSLRQSITVQKQWFELFRNLHDVCLTLPFGMIEHSPHTAIREIAAYLEVDASDAEFSRIQQALDKNLLREKYAALDKDQANVVVTRFSHFDATTFFHRRHVNAWKSNAAQDVLSLEEIAHIDRELGECVGLCRSHNPDWNG